MRFAATSPHTSPAFPKRLRRVPRHHAVVGQRQVVRAHYYHPAFHGSYSIKTVLPVLVPDMTYEGMAVGDGGAAMARFARMALGRCDRAEQEATRRDLLAYCGQDTIAMVRLHERLGSLC